MSYPQTNIPKRCHICQKITDRYGCSGTNSIHYYNYNNQDIRAEIIVENTRYFIVFYEGKVRLNKFNSNNYIINTYLTIEASLDFTADIIAQLINLTKKMLKLQVFS